ncbi:hypothetical protein E1H99_05260 [Enterococcus hirae]|nr:hypothetical protein E1H99_05260 [Enterococcus hirae]
MPQKGRISLKPNIQKKSGIPQAISREAIGKENNKLNDKNKLGNDQRVLNNVSNISGQTLTPEGIKRPVGWLHTWGTLLTMVPPLDFPDQQIVLKKTPPAFEVNTRIDVRREGNQTRIHSFVSTSTINRERFQSLKTPHTGSQPTSSVVLPFVSASSFFGNQTFYQPTSPSTQQDVDVAKRGHELSVFVHQKVHEIYQLANCSTTRRSDQVNTYIVAGESVEQTSFKTICQDAVGQAERQNNQEMKQERAIPSLSMDPMTDRTVQETPDFSAKEAARKLSKSFQATYENKQNATGDTTNVHNQMTEMFWNGLTELFYQFFYKHEHTASTQEQKEINGSLLSYFADWILSAFSVNYGEQIPNHRHSKNNPQIPMRTHLTDNSLSIKTSRKTSKKKKPENNPQELVPDIVPESVSKVTPMFSPEKESVLPQIWYLIEDFYGKVAGYIQHFNFEVFPQLGAEAAPIPSTTALSPVGEPPLQFSEKVSNEAQEKLENTITLYMRGYSGNQLWKQMPENLPTFWYDSEIFEKRDKLEQVNREVNKFICSNIRKCSTMTGQELLLAVKDWKKERDLATVKTKRRQLANIILTSSELPLQKLTDTRIAAILLQWQNNNIFKDYKFNDIKQTYTKITEGLNESQSSTTIPITLSPIKETTLQEAMTNDLTSELNEKQSSTETTVGIEENQSVTKTPEIDDYPLNIEIRVKREQIDLLNSNTPIMKSYEKLTTDEIKKINNIILNFLGDLPTSELTSEELPPFWFDEDMYQKRNETEKVNEAVKEIICEENDPCSYTTDKEMVIATQIWLLGDVDETESLKRAKQLAQKIIEVSGLSKQDMTEVEAFAIILQWRDNNIFRNQKFKAISQAPASTNQLQKAPVFKNSEIAGTTIRVTAHSYGPIPKEAMITANHIREAYLNDRPSPIDKSVPLIPIWYDYTLYKKRGDTDKANEAVKKFLCEQEVTCGELTNQQLVLTAKLWRERIPSYEIILEKKKELAQVILRAYGINDSDVSDTNTVRTIFQWENNNAFDDYPIIELLQEHLPESSSEKQTNPSNGEMKAVSDTIVDPELIKVHQLVQEIIYDVIPLSITKESLPIFYYDYELFQERAKTIGVNKALKEFLIKEGIEIKALSESELAMGMRKWIEKVDPKESFAKSGKRQYLAYFILKAYGVENVRLGEFMSYNKMNGILMQWKINTLLMGYSYIKSKKKTIHHHIGKTEHYLVPHFKKQKKINDQIYADFIHDRPASVSKEESIMPIYSHFNLFKNRDKTVTVNETVKNFLIGKGISFTNHSTSELVRQLREWIFRGETYSEITEREKEVAKLIRKAYGLMEKDIAINKARNVLLQWVNNNAQAGYKYKEIDRFEEIQLNQKIKAFIRDNGEAATKKGSSGTKAEEDPPLDETQKLEQRLRIIAFLIENGMKPEDTTPDKLVYSVANWGLLKGAAQETLDMVKVMQLGKSLLGKPQDAVITEQQALNIVVEWLFETAKESTPSLSTTPPEVNKKQITTSTQVPVVRRRAKYQVIQWQDPNVKKQISHFFQEKGFLTEEVTNEKILMAMGKWFTLEGSGIVLGHEPLQALAKVILNELNLYGGEGETLSDKDAELTIMKWVFENTLGNPIEAYAVKNILTASDPSQFTIGDLRKLFEVNELEKAGILDLDTQDFSDEEIVDFKKFWILLVAKTLPNYFLETSALADDLLISDYGSLIQLIGTKLLEDEGIRTQYSQEEIRTIGAFFLEEFIKTEVQNFDELHYILIPALLSVAQLEPMLLRKALEEGNYKEVAIGTFMGYWQKGNIQIMENERIFNKVFDLYQENTLKWRRKKVLAEEEAKKCIGEGAKTSALVLEQRYLGGSDPCPDYFTSPNIDDAYKTLTRAVSDSFYPFDKKLIEYATNSFDATERQFVFSPETQTYLAYAKLESKPSVPGRGTAPPFPAAYLNQQVVIQLAQCDLFIAFKGYEERLYALKKLEDNGGYIYYRVDKDPSLYLKFGLFDQTEIKKKGYKVEEDSIRVGNRLYTFSVRADQSKKLSHGAEREKFIDTLSLQHSEALYEQLYKSGDDKTITRQIWDVLKHFLPFYDCVTGIAEQDAAMAVPSCLIDIVLLIPVLGQITALNTRFALGVARAIATGGIRNGIRKGAQFLPNAFELKKVLYSVIRYMDPGFGLVAGGSKLLLKGLVKLKNQVYVTKEVKAVLEKLSKSIKASELPSGVVMAHLPDGPQVAVKLVKDHLYTPVTNLNTGTVSGRYFVLKGDQLEPFRGPVTFTPDELALINRLSAKINIPENVVSVPNVNPKAYGTGTVLVMKKDGEEAKTFIKINHQLVSLRITPIEGHGVRFDVLDGEKIIPVNHNGVEWYFEASTSPYVTKELADEVTKKIDKFESLKDPTVLSPPYEHGLMSNENGRTYIKINDHYIPLILFDKNNGRYHLVKKDMDEPMIVLRFDPDSDGFKMETFKEKEELKLLNQEAIISRKGKAQSKWKSGSSTEKDSSAGTSQGSLSSTHETGPGTSSQGSSITSTSTGAIPKVFSRPADIPTIDFPEPPNNWATWKDFKKAEPLPDRITIEEDANIDLTKLSEFPPSWEAYYKTGEDSIRQNVYKAIDVSFPRPIPQLEVFTGLDSTGMPNYLKPFFEQLRDDFEAAKKRFDAAVRLFNSTWKMEDISRTKEGAYLIEMFKLQGVPKAETEEILRESIRKLYTTAEHGKMFLQKSKDLFFKNVWTLSSKLVYDREALSYYSKIQDIIRSEAFTVKYDGECRIFILADAFHLDPKVLPEAHIQPTGYETVMHEVTHIMSDAEDLLQYGLVRRGLRKNGKRTLDYYDNKYPNVTKEDSIQMKYYRDYLAKVLSSPNLTVKKIIEALEVNHTLRVHFQLTDAEMLMTILRDLVEGRAFDAIFRAKRESDQEQDGKKSDSLETIKEQLGTGNLFTLQALIYTIGFINFEREFQQSKTQEKTIDIPESTSTKTTNSPTTGNRNKREIVSTTIESAESITNQSLLKLINQSIERSNNPDYSVSDQSVSTDLPEKVSKRRALNHVTTNIENNPNHFISDPQIIIGIPKDTEKKSFLDIVFTSRNRSAQKNPTKGFNRPINKNQKILAPQH